MFEFYSFKLRMITVPKLAPMKFTLLCCARKTQFKALGSFPSFKKKKKKEEEEEEEKKR
jgi:hypothetical protein